MIPSTAAGKTLSTKHYHYHHCPKVMKQEDPPKPKEVLLLLVDMVEEEHMRRIDRWVHPIAVFVALEPSELAVYRLLQPDARLFVVSRGLPPVVDRVRVEDVQ